MAEQKAEGKLVEVIHKAFRRSGLSTEANDMPEVSASPLENCGIQIGWTVKIFWGGYGFELWQMTKTLELVSKIDPEANLLQLGNKAGERAGTVAEFETLREDW